MCDNFSFFIAKNFPSPAANKEILWSQKRVSSVLNVSQIITKNVLIKKSVKQSFLFIDSFIEDDNKNDTWERSAKYFDSSQHLQLNNSMNSYYRKQEK